MVCPGPSPQTVRDPCTQFEETRVTLRMVEPDVASDPAATPRQLLGGMVPVPAVEVNDRTVLRTPRLLLRPLAEADRDQFIALVVRSRAHLDRWSALHRPGETDQELFARQLELTRLGDRRSTAVRRAIFLHDATLIGSCNLNSISRGLQFESDSNWWIGAEFAGKGLATEAVRALTDHALRELPEGLGLHRVFAGIRPDNAASIRVAAKCGFTRQQQVKSYLNVGGAWELHDIYVRDVLDEVPGPV